MVASCAAMSWNISCTPSPGWWSSHDDMVRIMMMMIRWWSSHDDEGLFFQLPHPPLFRTKKRPISQPEVLVDERFHGGAALVGSLVFLSFGSVNHPLWWGSLGVRAKTYTNIIWEAVQTLIWSDMTWFDLIWGLTSPARRFVNTRHQVVTLKMKRISKTLEV